MFLIGATASSSDENGRLFGYVASYVDLRIDLYCPGMVDWRMVEAGMTFGGVSREMI